MVYNSLLANSMLTSCKNVNAPEIIQAVEREQGAAAGPARTTRMWLHDTGQHKSMIDPSLPVQHDYNFLETFCTAKEKNKWLLRILPSGRPLRDREGRGDR